MTANKEHLDDTVVMLTNEMAEVVRQETKLKEADALKMAKALVNGLRKRLGGQDIYIPAADKTERDIGIMKEFTGTADSLNYVMNKYSVTKSTVYWVCKRRRFLLSGKK